MTEDDKSEGRWQGKIEQKQRDFDRRIAWLEGKFWAAVVAIITIALAQLGIKI